MDSRILAAFLAAASCFSGACAPSSDTSDDSSLAVAQLALTVVPTGVLCLRATVTIGATTTTAPLVTVAAGASSASISIGQLASGAAIFNAQAFSLACASVTTTTVASWIADPATATLAAGVLTTVPLTFRRNNTVAVSSNFVDNVAQISAGSFSTYAIMADGTLKAWGLSGGTFSSTPLTVPNITNVVQVSGGNNFTCVRKGDGTVWCWGFNRAGAMGPGVPLNTFQTTPVKIPLTSILQAQATAIDLSAGNAHVCVVTNPDPITDTSQVMCWGSNNAGQLGDGTTTDNATPVLTQTLRSVSRVVAGVTHTCAVGSDGSILCWGSNTFGELGDGTGLGHLTPTQVPGLALEVDLGLGNSHTCALRGDGLMRCWGQNGSGQIGDGTNTTRLSPTAVPGITDGVQVALGQNSTCVRRATGAINCWGLGGTLGDGVGDNRNTPGTVPNLTGALQLRAHDGNHACAEMSDRTVKCWGDNSEGQIGDGTAMVAATPTLVHLQ